MLRVQVTDAAAAAVAHACMNRCREELAQAGLSCECWETRGGEAQQLFADAELAAMARRIVGCCVERKQCRTKQFYIAFLFWFQKYGLMRREVNLYAWERWLRAVVPYAEMYAHVNSIRAWQYEWTHGNGQYVERRFQRVFRQISAFRDVESVEKAERC